MPIGNLVDRRSLQLSKEELLFFESCGTQVCVDSSFTKYFMPKNPLIANQPITFEFNSGDGFFDPASIKLRTRFQIVRNDGGALVCDAADGQIARDFCSVINYISQTFINQVRLWANGKLIFDSGDGYMHRAYLETLLGSSEDQKRTLLEAGGWLNDDPDNMDVVGNEGAENRAQWTANSREFEVIGGFAIDLFNQPKYLPNRTTFMLELYKAPDNLILLSDRNHEYRLRVTNCVLIARTVEPTKSLLMAFEKQLLSTPIKYPLRRTIYKILPIHALGNSLPDTHVYTGILPRKLVLAFVNQESRQGNYALNPFNYQHFFISRLVVRCGNQTIPLMGMDIDMNLGRFKEPYTMLHEATQFDDKTCGITMKQFINGMFILIIDTTPDRSSASPVFQVQRQGTVELDLRLQNPLVAPMDVICCLEFDGITSCDANRTFYSDFAA